MWLYQHAGQVFGPVSARELLRMLYDGDLDFEVLVAPDGGEFKPARRYGLFRSQKTKIDSHRAQVRTAESRQARERSRRFRRVIRAIAVSALVLAGGGWALQSWIRSSRLAQAEAAKQREERRLREELDSLLSRVTVEPPLEPLIDGAAPTSTDRPAKSPKRRRKTRRSRRPSSAVGPQLTDEEILRGVASVLPRFKRCIVEQIQRSADSVPERIVLQFAIGNDGRAKNFTVEDRILRRSPLQPCLTKQISTARWRAFKGEVRNVEYPIRINRN